MLEQLDLDMFNEMATASSSQWGHAEELLLGICARMDTLVRLMATVHSERKPQFGPPFEYPRPGLSGREAAVEQAKATHPREVARLMLMGGG